MTLEECKKQHILKVYNDQDHNLRSSSKILGIAERTLYNYLNMYWPDRPKLKQGRPPFQKEATGKFLSSNGVTDWHRGVG